ncbi:MAG: ABC transporter permease, partial [Candidatus Zixiibacteriota bacterium]
RIGDGTIPMAHIMPPMGPAIEAEIPEVERVVRIRNVRDGWVEREDKKFTEKNIMIVDRDFFSVFSVPLIQGDSVEVLRAPNSVVISESAARKYFGSVNPVGQTLNFLKDYDLTITGIMADIKANTQLKTDFLVSYSSLEKTAVEDESPWMQIMTDYTYLLLRPGVSPESLEGRFIEIMGKNLDPDRTKMFTFWLQPLGSIYLHSHLSSEFQPHGNMTSIYLFSSIAFVLLFIACINYINLVTSKTSHRTTEVGVRKVLGAVRSQLVKQFMAESIILCLIAMILGAAIFELLRPALSIYIGKEIEYGIFTNPIFLVSSGILAIIIGIISGSYPAFYLSKFKPAAVLKSGFKSGASKSLLRRILVVIQFVIAIGLIFCTVNLYMLMNHWQTKDRGFSADNILIVTLDRELYGDKATILKNEILKQNRVLSASAMTDPPGGWSLTIESMRPEYLPEDSTTLMYSLWGDRDILQTFEFVLLQGSNFSESLGVDINRQVILDELAVKKLNLNNPVGMRLIGTAGTEYEIVGVVKEFQGRPMSESKLASMIRIIPDNYEDVAVKLYPDNKAATIAGIEKTWNQVFPDYPFEARFLSEIIQETYEDYNKIGILFIAFSVLVIFIACLGVFGLSAYSAEQRYKEIGIRKVLGSSEIEVVKLLTKEFIILVGIASLIALPTAFILMNQWLESMANRINPGWVSFVLSAGIATIVTIITVSYQAVKAAYANPVTAIRHE